MTPRTRSGGADHHNGQVYQTTATVRQVQFPTRRTRIRPLSNIERSQELPPPSTAERLRQQTLTQIDFVSSSFMEEDVVAMSSDSDMGDNESMKENRKQKTKSLETSNFKYKMPQSESEDDDDEPTARRRKRKPPAKPVHDQSKRRRTIGEDIPANIRRTTQPSRRKTIGDPPASSNYHTQTLTQFIGRDSFIADSDDEDLDNADDGFLNWLGDDNGNKNTNRDNSEHPVAPATAVREESVVPQTPVKSIRFQLPESDQETEPTSLKVARYGAPDIQVTPSKPKSTPTKPTALRNKLVIEDSYATESWTSQQTTPSKKTPTHSQLSAEATPTRTGPIELSPLSLQEPCRDEIPDSDDEGDFTQDMVEEEVLPAAATDKPQLAIKQTEMQAALDEKGQTAAVDENHAPETFNAGNETQLIMDQLQSSASQWTKTPPQPKTSTEDEIPSSIQTTQSTAPYSSAKEHPSPTQPEQKRVRRPLSQPGSTNTQGFPLESQRVAVSILHSFPPVDVRSDVLLPIATRSLSQLLDGYTVSLSLPFKIAPQVVRIWLLDQHNLQHMAIVDGTVEPGQGDMWSHPIHQVYELNNPVGEDDIRAEEWIVGPIGKYKYLPPVYVSQLLWNLRNAVFSDQEQQPDHTAEQTPNQHTSSSQVLNLNLIPSTPDEDDDNDQFHEASSQRLSNTMPPPSLPASASQPPPHRSRPGPPPIASQASTASQASPSQSQLSSRASGLLRPQIPDSHANASSDSVVFIDPSSSSLQMPDNLLDSCTSGVDNSDNNFQLLTKSQLLPDSLLRDDAHLPNEIWDSSEE